ncbi:putative RNA recognition motif domain, nucleotide-binding alpha-beta plait domain superfamily [Helianthus annuus]|uniref:RNA recognition motif domain, nucleotide-binding alpha-beta plait domain superfamily n=1 Tax=Helianthus annuus TaxID=4232 RepID=A0A9K3JT15_HELAN|nr:putative RNA recognition motif domain, nucleotide-binding alpha-beta plait domain superfamily [Helianthus annuus]KAJ0610911.1 putative RNA recognition motif domain, nucleotide-binding alpha-beta plait domain superfamily [Helianthus annuus]KAJ0621764.1 putative RNA recognition motif domain, nucleotide-binding alpha-beta plait domain superfamily [Helianthus annuus]KAJ0626168.1 putative RNA recognition motif domain, nucleotide-binding alpha-beta plait domain superfamily [Helianthus annuus]KAJ07
MGRRRGNQPRDEFFDNIEELRRRKTEELRKLGEQGEEYDPQWCKAKYRRTKKQEDSVRRRIERWEKASTFFISNLPGSCDSVRLWQAFECYPNLEDAFVPKKKDRMGNKFGFIRLSNVARIHDWVQELAKIRIDGAVIGVKIALFNRDGSKRVGAGKGNATEVSGTKPVPEVPFHAEMDPEVPQDKGFGGACGQGASIKGGTGRSYAQILMGLDKDQEVNLQVRVEEVPNLPVSGWGEKALVGEAKSFVGLESLFLEHSSGLPPGVSLKYLGGLRVLLVFQNPEEAMLFLAEKEEVWSKWLASLSSWKGQLLDFQRLAWLSIKGVPLDLWDKSTFNAIGGKFGRIFQPSTDSTDDGFLLSGSVGILVSHGRLICESLELLWGNRKCLVWVQEEVRSWSFPVGIGSINVEKNVEGSKSPVSDEDARIGIGITVPVESGPQPGEGLGNSIIDVRACMHEVGGAGPEAMAGEKLNDLDPFSNASGICGGATGDSRSLGCHDGLQDSSKHSFGSEVPNGPSDWAFNKQDWLDSMLNKRKRGPSTGKSNSKSFRQRLRESTRKSRALDLNQAGEEGSGGSSNSGRGKRKMRRRCLEKKRDNQVKEVEFEIPDTFETRVEGIDDGYETNWVEDTGVEEEVEGGINRVFSPRVIAKEVGDTMAVGDMVGLELQNFEVLLESSVMGDMEKAGNK